MNEALFSYDRSYRERGHKNLLGIDEAGRGPWAGPVVAAAVILPENISIDGLNDSKKLSPQKREKLFDIINNSALDVTFEVVDNDVIDCINILQATFKAMREAISKIKIQVDLILVDGSFCIPGIAFQQDAIISGDGKSASIAAASIIAKVTRDRIMLDYSEKYPQYNFKKHKGYGTSEHLNALKQYGPCPIHRKSFAPVKDLDKY